jgi:hypothetical protein
MKAFSVPAVLLVLTVAVGSHAMTMRVHYSGGTFDDFDLAEVAKLTLEPPSMTVHLAGGGTQAVDLSTVTKLTFDLQAGALRPEETRRLRQVFAVICGSPFEPTTDIRFSVEKRARVTIDVFGAGGQTVRTLEQGMMAPGEQAVRWDRKDTDGRRAGPGAYVVRVRVGDSEVARKLIIVGK